MSDLHQAFATAMDLIEDAHQNRHLLNPSDLFQHFRDIPDYFDKLKFGMTSHPMFEQLAISQLTYALKPKMSASTAIESLLNSETTFIDCGVASNIAYYLTLLWAMRQEHGEIKGNERFDAFFGSKTEITPVSRRLILSPFSIAMGTSMTSINNQLPIHPLSYFINKEFVSTTSDLEKKAKIGSQIFFSGDPSYLSIHPAEHHGSYVCFITSLQPIKVRSFSLGKKELTEQELTQIHKKAYAEEVSVESLCFLKKHHQNPQEFLTLFPKDATDEAITGFEPYFYDIINEKYNFLLKGRVQEVIQGLDNYINFSQEKVRNIFFARYESSLNNLAQNFETFGFGFNKQEKEQPRPEAMPIKPNKENFLPGFNKGFLNNQNQNKSKNMKIDLPEIGPTTNNKKTF